MFALIGLLTFFFVPAEAESKYNYIRTSCTSCTCGAGYTVFTFSIYIQSAGQFVSYVLISERRLSTYHCLLTFPVLLYV